MTDLDGEPAAGPGAGPGEARKQSLDPASVRAEYLARARELGWRLGVEVEIDETGLRSEVELTFDKQRDELRPVKVRVGRDATDETVLAEGGVLASCRKYNATLVLLRQLAKQLTHQVRHGTIRLEPGSPVAAAHRQLSELDDLIANRQRITMGQGVVRLTTLRRETEYLASYHDLTAAIVQAAGQTTDDDTSQGASVRTQQPSPFSHWLRCLYACGVLRARS